MTITVLAPNDDMSVAPSNNPTSAYAASLVIKASPGVLYGLTGYNSGAAKFLQLHDAGGLPSDTAIPVEVIAIAATSNFSIDFGVHGKRFLTGIVACNSSTAPTKTIGAADCWISPRFK